MPLADSLFQILSHLPLFQALEPEQLQSIRGSVVEKRLAKGEFLFQRGDAATGFYVVAYGRMKLAIPTPQGLEKVVEIIGPRQSLGEAVMFLDRPFPVNAEALEDSLLLRIDRVAVDKLLSEDASFARRMLAGLSQRLHSLLQDVEAYSLRSSTQRVIGYLLEQCAQQESMEQQSEEQSAQAVELPTTKQVIASRLNLTPETLSRIFQELSRNGLIEVQGRTVAIASVQRLQEFDV
ncbi:MAG TPA: Crp/Fnr family transcriptional regulator [Rhodocyclaceae bacterium]|nr:Crp/Fnr family transcriptional regulator [Rhodocyclaceae bacterium]